ncbi:MAG TPA: TylF/MycF/NovP-related O-methyltransferase [Usitatibacter sp.]|nr:TylF/MycF/NovP-related O-methyltransferase [Usitatibacter sp.]
MAILVDKTTIAHWERFEPVQDRGEDWQTYLEFPGRTKDSLSKRMRCLSLAQLVRNVAAIKGSFAECGCLLGDSTYMIARTMTRIGRSDPMHVFDSFEGLSPRSPEDRKLSPNHIDRMGVQAMLESGVTMFRAEFESTKRNLSPFPFVHLYPGWIPSRFPEVASETFAFVHIDVDLYEPILKSLEFFYPRLAPGGVIQIDDYNFMDWPGAKTAVDQFLATNKASFFFQLPLGGAFLIK